MANFYPPQWGRIKKKKKIIQKRQNNWIVWPFNPIYFYSVDPRFTITTECSHPEQQIHSCQNVGSQERKPFAKQQIPENCRTDITNLTSTSVSQKSLNSWLFYFLHNVNEKFFFCSSSSQIKNSMWHLKNVKTWSTPRMRVSIIINIFRFL